MNDSEEASLILDFVESQYKQNHQRKRVYVQTLRDECNINFHDLLERQWTLDDQSQKFFHSKHMLPEDVIPSFLEANKNKLNLRSKNQRKAKLQVTTKNVVTIFQSPQYIEDIDLYLSSDVFGVFIKIVVLLNFVGLFLTDYQFRLEEAFNQLKHLSTYNSISLNLQLLANCVFSIQIILQYFSSKAKFSNPWIILNLLGTIACWATIFYDMTQQDGGLYQILIIIRTLRGIRIIQVFESLKNPFQVFIGTLPALNKIFFPMFVLMFFYAISGMALYSGANQNRCRYGSAPVDGEWLDYYDRGLNSNLCGASMFTCPIETYCGNPNDYGLPYDQAEVQQRSKDHGLISFDNFFHSVLTVYHYVFLSNFSGIIFKFSRNINPYLTSFYFVSMAVVLFFIISNLIMISISKAYIQKQKLLEKLQNNKQEQKQEQSVQEMTFSIKIINILQTANIVLQCFVLLMDYEGLSETFKERISQIDIFLTMLAIFLILLRIFILGKTVQKNPLNYMDWIIYGLTLIDFIMCGINQLPLVYNLSEESIILRSFTFVRIIKLIYISENYFIYQKTIINLFFKTLKNMKFFLLLLVCIMLVFSLIGKLLFAYRVRFDTTDWSVDIKHGQPYVEHYESGYKAIVSIVLLFQNQRWTQTMYSYYHAVGMPAVIFYALLSFFVHLMLTRLFIAVFLCYFRRNLEKKSEHKKNAQSQVSIKEIVQNYKTEKQNKTVIQENNSNQPQQKQSNQQLQQSKNISHTLFWIFDRNCCPFQLVRIVYNSKIFYYFVLIAILIQALTIIVRTSADQQSKTNALNAIQNISLSIYCFEVIFGIIGYGFYFENNSYLKKCHFNKLNFLVLLFIICSLFTFAQPFYINMIRRLAVLKIITLLKRKNKQMDIILEAISQISKKFIRILIIYIFFLLIASIIPLRLLKDAFYNCHNAEHFSHFEPTNGVDCMNAGGDWVEDAQNFNNIFSSIVLMYQIVTSQSWTYFIELSIRKSPYWDIFYVGIFFFYNVCLLNIFIGLIVQTYLQLKDKAYKLNLLRPTQRGWILIKNCINQLVPEPMVMYLEQRAGFFYDVTFGIITNQVYSNAIDILAYVITVIFAMRDYRASQQYTSILIYIQNVILLFFVIDTILKAFALKKQYFYLDNCKVQICGFLYIIIYWIIMTTTDLTHQTSSIVRFFLVVLLILRCKKILFRFTWSKTLINSVIQILPKCIQIGTLLAIVLFVYVAIGLQVFKYVKPVQNKADGYTTGFNNFFTGLLTLVKVASNQSWFDQVTVYVRTHMQSGDICHSIKSTADAQKYGGMGCGTLLAYPFFITFHMIMVLFILNLLIATMVSAYDENYQKQYNSVNVFQLQDCLGLWKKYDHKGTGVIPYKQFWKLSSQIGILFGISKKKLIKNKQKFLEQLGIPIYQSINPSDTSILCYRFHDVITQFSKIKLQVSLDKGDQSSNSIQFDIHPMIQKQIKDFTTKIPDNLYKNYKPFKNYSSGEMKYVFGLLRKLRSWKSHSKSKSQIKVSKLSRIIKVAMQKKIQQQNMKNLLAFCSGQKKEEQLLKESIKEQEQEHDKFN